VKRSIKRVWSVTVQSRRAFSWRQLMGVVTDSTQLLQESWGVVFGSG
jgi:hypothetical protein